jgi:hypothetical protein
MLHHQLFVVLVGSLVELFQIKVIDVFLAHSTVAYYLLIDDDHLLLLSVCIDLNELRITLTVVG